MTEDVQGLVGPNGAGEPSQLWGGALSPSCPSDPDKGSWFNQPAQLRSGVISLKDKGRYLGELSCVQGDNLSG